MVGGSFGGDRSPRAKLVSRPGSGQIRGNKPRASTRPRRIVCAGGGPSAWSDAPTQRATSEVHVVVHRDGRPKLTFAVFDGGLLRHYLDDERKRLLAEVLRAVGEHALAPKKGAVGRADFCVEGGGGGDDYGELIPIEPIQGEATMVRRFRGRLRARDAIVCQIVDRASAARRAALRSKNAWRTRRRVVEASELLPIVESLATSRSRGTRRTRS
jgi:hypothetical protein